MEKPIALFVHQDSLLKKEADKTFAITYQSIFVKDFTEAARVLKCKIVSCIIDIKQFITGKHLRVSCCDRVQTKKVLHAATRKNNSRS